MHQETLKAILIIDDSPDNLELMAFMLRQIGYQVATAFDGRDGLEIAKRILPDLIISDVSMPGVDGIEFCRRIRADEQLCAVPIILVTALRKDEESSLEGLQAGADDYLEAPYEPARLIAKVKRLLARRDAEEALKASKQQLQFITDTAPAYIFHCDTERRYKFVNRRYAERFGARPEDVVGRLIVDLLGARAYASIEQYISKALSGESVEFETEIPYEQLGKRYMHCAYVPEFGARGEVKGFVAVITDITERRRVEEALREGRQSLVRAQQVAHIGNWDWDMLTDNVYWSDEMYRIYGVSPETFAPTFDSVMRFVHPDDLGLVNRTLENVLKELTPSNIDYRIIRPDGTVRAVSGQAEVYSEEARAVRMVGTVQDITERRRAEELLRENQELFRTAFDYAAIGMALVSIDGRWLKVNRSMCEIVGYSEQELLTTTFQAITHPDDLAADLDYISQLLGGEILSYQMEKRYCHKLGHFVWVLLSVSLVRDAQGNPQYFVSQVQDITERKRAEEALRASEEQFRTMADSIPQLAWMAHADGFIFWYNQRWHDYTGTTPEQMEGWGWQSVHDPEVLQQVLERWRAAIATGELFEMEFPLRGADGRFRTFLTRVQPLKDSQGRVVQWFGTNTDVDELKRMEEKQRETQARLNSALAAGSIGTWSWDIVNDRLVADEFTARMFSVEADAASKGLPVELYLQSLYEEDRPRVENALKRAIQSRSPYDVEYRVLLKGGESRWLQARGRVEADAAGNALRLDGAVMDITERKRAEEALLESEAKLSGIIESAMDAIITVDTDQNIVLFNQAAEQMFQCSAEEVIGRALDRFIPQSFREAHRRHIRDFGKTGVTTRAMAAARNISGLRADGTEFPLEASISQIEAQGEKLYTVILRDISQRKRAENYLKESSEQMRALSARLESAREEEGVRIARELHDELGGALTGLRWDLQSVSQKLANLDIEAGTRTHVQAKIESMNDLIDSSLETVRRISSELRPTILDDLGLAEAIQWKARQFQARTGITALCHSLAEVEGVRGAPALAVYRVLQEALTNVLRHAQATRVDLFISSKDGEFTLEVRDDGRGISEKESDITHSLGLLGMRERVQFVGGQFSITGTPGKGTTVIARVPLDGATREL